MIDDDAVKWYTEKSKVGELDVVIKQAIAAMTMIPITKIKVLKMSKSVERRIDASKP
jgi:hypothetical protein